MEQSFRIALWMFLLIGYLQAQPVPTKDCFDMNELGFDYLRDISCKNVNFTTPTNVKDECLAEAVKFYTKGMEAAINNCNESSDLKNTLEEFPHNCLTHTQTNYCTFTMTVHEQFGTFLNATKAFVEQANTQHRRKK